MASTGYETITYDAGDGVARLTLNRPAKRNAVNLQMFTELGEATEQAARDPDVRAVLVRGEGPSFSAGIDLSSFAEIAGGTQAAFRGFGRVARRPYANLATMPKPVVGAIQGHALGAGFQLALACDLRVVAEDSQFAMLEIRYGIVPDLGGTHLLPALVGPARAKELVWTGRTIDAAEAERIGLADRVVSPGELEKSAEELVGELASRPPMAVSAAKELISRAGQTALETQMDLEQQVQTALLRSEDHKEAVAAYFEKRPGKFKGR